MKIFHWTDGSGRLNLAMSEEQAQRGFHRGSCDDDVAALLNEPNIRDQVAKWDRNDLSAVLQEHGAWDAVELADHEQNRARMVWVACADVVDAPERYLT